MEVRGPRWADVFDGIDLNWEYPNACADDQCDTSDPAALKTMMQAVRSEFGTGSLVTAAVPAGKLLLGIGSYGRGWTGVSQSALRGSATGAAEGTFQKGIEPRTLRGRVCDTRPRSPFVSVGRAGSTRTTS